MSSGSARVEQHEPSRPVDICRLCASTRKSSASDSCRAHRERRTCAVPTITWGPSNPKVQDPGGCVHGDRDQVREQDQPARGARARQGRRRRGGRRPLRRSARHVAALQPAARRARRATASRTGSASTARASAASRRSTRATCSSSRTPTRRPSTRSCRTRRSFSSATSSTRSPASRTSRDARLHRQEGRGAPAPLGHRRRQLLGPGGGVLPLQLAPLRPERAQRLLLHRLARKASGTRAATPSRTWPSGRGTRRATSRCRRPTSCRTCAPRSCSS